MAGVLGISPGTRTVGIAVQQHIDTPHMEGHIKTFSGKWSEKKQIHILNYLLSLIATYSIRTIAIKTIPQSLSSWQFNQLQRAIKDLAKKYKLKYRTYTLEEIKEHVGAKKTISKTVIMDYLIGKYPELLREFTKEKRNQNPYYIKLFEAIAVADMALYTT